MRMRNHSTACVALLSYTGISLALMRARRIHVGMNACGMNSRLVIVNKNLNK